MMMLVNNWMPFIGIIFSVWVLIKVKYRTMSIDAISLMLLFITSFAILADADIQNNGFVPVWETVVARVLQILIVLFVMSVLKRYTRIRAENAKLKEIIEQLQS